MISKPKYPYKNIFQEYFLIASDTESYKFQTDYGQNQKLAIGSIYDGSHYGNFKNKYEFISLISQYLNHKKVLIAFHNLKIDLQWLNLLDDFIQNKNFLGYHLEQKMIGNVNYFRFVKKEKRITKEIVFIDTTNFFKSKLKKIGESLGYKKFADEEYNLQFEAWNKYIDKNGIELCNKDCLILYKLLEEMSKEKIIKFGISTADSCFRTYKEKFMPIDFIDLDAWNLIVCELYHGGRTELYHKMISEYSYSVDINSMYAFVMKKYKYSVKFHKIFDHRNLNLLLKNLRNESYNYILMISFKTKLSRTPIMTKTKNGMLCDFQEQRQIFVTGQEFLSLYDSDKDLIFQIHIAYEFINMDLFSTYIDYFYDLKKNNTGIKKDFYKLNLTGLYGKFGQRESFVNFEPYASFPELENFKENQRINYNGKTYTLYENFYSYTVEGEYKNASLISAEITANARVENFKIQNKIGFDNIYSTDTDSFRINKNTLEFITKNTDIMGEELGQCKIEYDKSGIHYGYGLKDYEIILDDGTKITKKKGVRKDALRILSLKELDLNSDKVKKIIKKYKIKSDKDLQKIYLYKSYCFKPLNHHKDVDVEDVYKVLNYEITKLKYDKNGYSTIFENEDDFLRYNKINISEKNIDNCAVINR